MEHPSSTGMHLVFRILATVMGVIRIASTGFAAVPVLDHLFPVAVQTGSSNRVILVGKCDPWPPNLWVEGSGVHFEATTNNGIFSIVVATNAEPGIRWVRAFNGEGASAPRFLMVTTNRQSAEVEPNDEFGKAQRIEGLPAVINGRLEKSGDVDSFEVTLRQGQTLVAWVEAYIWMSPLDAALRLVDERGIQRALNHDDGRTLDPLLTYPAVRDGRVVVQLFGFPHPADSDIRLTGNAKCVYRLHLVTGPAIRHTMPLGVNPKRATPLRITGWNLPFDASFVFSPEDSRIDPESTRISLQPPEFERGIEVSVGMGSEGMESEPNDSISTANTVEIPSSVSGCVSTIGDEDRYSFRAQGGVKLLLDVESSKLGFPLDAWLKIEDAEGKEIVRNDDSTGSDPSLEWTPSKDGTYFAVIGNLLHRGGPDHLYRLSIHRPVPTFKPTLAEGAFSLESGKTNLVKVNIVRSHGFDRELTAEVLGLPPGVTAGTLTVSPKTNEVSMALVATADAKPHAGPFQIRFREKSDAPGRDQNAILELVSGGENNGVPQGYRRLVRESMDRPWLTVTSSVPAKAATLPTEK